VSTGVEAPIFIVGRSRSGTTALSHLLARDPANRPLDEQFSDCRTHFAEHLA
jgi:Sulfotransferase family